MNKWFKLGLFVPLILSLVTACNFYYSNLEERQEIAKAADDKSQDITIALVETSAKKDNWFIEGARLAIKEINDNGGILEGREFKAEEYDDKGNKELGQEIARKIARNLNIVAVIGHRYSKVAVPTSITYEENGIVFISTGSTVPKLTAHKNLYIFRNVPSDKTIGQGLAKFAATQKFKKIFVIFERTDYGKQLAEFFREGAESKERNLEVVKIRSYNAKQTDFRSLFLDAQEFNFDAIFVAGGISNATKLIKQARSLGIVQPFIGGDSLDNPILWNEVKYGAIGTFVASVFNPNQNKLSQRFVENFKKDNGIEPDAKAAQGYDAVKVLSRAIENSKSTIPIDIAMALRYMRGWRGAVGSYNFLRSGDIDGRYIHIKRLSADGEFKFVNE